MTLIATPTHPVTIYYCKAGIKTGLTIRLLHRGQVHQTADVTLANAQATMAHDNSTGPARRSGARCVLVVRQGEIHYQQGQVAA